MALKSKNSEASGSMPNGAGRRLLQRILFLVVFTLVGFGVPNLEAQNKNRRAPTGKSQSSNAESQSLQLIFDYYPSALSTSPKESEYVFVAIARDGRIQAVRYGAYNAAVIAVYEGKLPKDEIARLFERVQSANPKASEINIPYVGSCDADHFQLSLIPKNGARIQTFMVDPGCVMVMPKDILDLVEEIRTMWKRCNEAPLAYGYIRSFPLNEDFLKSPQRNARQFISIKKFPSQLRVIARDARKQTPKFHAVTRAQCDQLLAVTSDPSHFYVIDEGRAYSLAFSISRNALNSRINE